MLNELVSNWIVDTTHQRSYNQVVWMALAMTQNWREKMRHSDENGFRQQLSVSTSRRQALGLNDRVLCPRHQEI